MVTVYMTQKTCERVVPPLDVSKVVNLYEVSDAFAKTFETNSEYQGTLRVRKPVRLKDNGTIRTLYNSSECRHPAVFVCSLGPTLSYLQSFKASDKVHQDVRSFQFRCTGEA